MVAISDAIPSSQVSSAVGIKTEYKDNRAGNVRLLPQRIGVVGQGCTASTYSTTKATVTSALEVATAYGFGSPLHLACLQLFPTNGDGVGTIPVTVYPLEDDGTGVAATGDITTTGTTQDTDTTYYVKINNILSAPVAMVAADTPTTATAKFVAAINAISEMPVIAADSAPACDLTSKWKGASANDIYVEIVGVTDGLTFTVTQPTSGANNPDVDTGLNQVGITWETMLLNCMDVADTTTLGKYTTWGTGRWGATVHMPAVVFSGDVNTTVASAITVPDARKTDYINSQLVEPAGHDLPFVVAARQLARIAVQANDNPPVNYQALTATGLVPGVDGSQWTNAQKEQAVLGGSSTINSVDGEVRIGDVITFYHPTGDPLPAYRFVVDIVKLQNVIYNVALIFEGVDWAGAPLIPDDQPTTNPAAKKPKTAIGVLAKLADELGEEAIISDPETTKANIQAEIDSVNPKRLNVVFPVTVSGNTNIKSINLPFAFYFGG